jgi:hypothetical protein
MENPMGTCRTCEDRYDDGGDGYDGECPSCADKTYEAELLNDLTGIGKIAVAHGMDVHDADMDDEDLTATLAHLESVEGDLNQEELKLYNAWKAESSSTITP